MPKKQQPKKKPAQAKKPVRKPSTDPNKAAFNLVEQLASR